MSLMQAQSYTHDISHDGQAGKDCLWSLFLTAIFAILAITLIPPIFVDPVVEAIRFAREGKNARATILTDAPKHDSSNLLIRMQHPIVQYDGLTRTLAMWRLDSRLPPANVHELDVVYLTESPKHPWIGSREDGTFRLWWRNRFLQQTFGETLSNTVKFFFFTTACIFILIATAMYFLSFCRSLFRFARERCRRTQP